MQHKSFPREITQSMFGVGESADAIRQRARAILTSIKDLLADPRAQVPLGLELRDDERVVAEIESTPVF